MNPRDRPLSEVKGKRFTLEQYLDGYYIKLNHRDEWYLCKNGHYQNKSNDIFNKIHDNMWLECDEYGKKLYEKLQPKDWLKGMIAGKIGKQGGNPSQDWQYDIETNTYFDKVTNIKNRKDPLSVVASKKLWLEEPKTQYKHTFKVGDEVQVKSKPGIKFGKIKKLHSDKTYTLETKSGFFTEAYIELYVPKHKFKIGDVITRTSIQNGPFTIKSIDEKKKQYKHTNGMYTAFDSENEHELWKRKHKFKIGDRVKFKINPFSEILTIIDVNDEFYVNNKGQFFLEDEDKFELIENKFEFGTKEYKDHWNKQFTDFRGTNTTVYTHLVTKNNKKIDTFTSGKMSFWSYERAIGSFNPEPTEEEKEYLLSKKEKVQNITSASNSIDCLTIDLTNQCETIIGIDYSAAVTDISLVGIYDEIMDESIPDFKTRGEECKYVLEQQKEKKENPMNPTTKREVKSAVQTLSDALCTETKVAKVKTEFESRFSVHGTIYDRYGNELDTIGFKSVKAAKRHMQQPENLGRTMTIHQEIKAITTNIPIVEVK